MSIINANPLLAAAGGDYQISRSVRLRSSASAWLTRPFATPTNSSKWTMSMWVKRGALNALQGLFGKTISTSANFYLAFDAGNTMTWTFTNSALMTTTQVFRDPSAGYHVIAVWDSANATPSQRARLYVNGTEITSFSTDQRSSITTGADAWNTTNTAYMHAVGAMSATSSTVANYFDGYLTEVNFIDGQALTPSSFGETDSITGVWKPKKYAGTYGTNGFYLNFSDNSAATAAAIGKDYSGNGNNWTPNNISVTAGVTYDSMLDVPTMFADGGNGRGNYATLNPLIQRWVLNNTVTSNGNLQTTNTTNAGVGVSLATMLVSSGKFYAEASITATGLLSDWGIGVGSGSEQSSVFTDTAIYTASTGAITGTAAGATYTTGDVIGIALNKDTNQISFYKNNTIQGTAALPTNVPMTFILLAGRNGGSGWLNCGQRPFAYTPPTGFKALNTQNLPDSTIPKGSSAFNVVLDTGANIKASTEALFGNGLYAIKDRANANNWQWVDYVSGTSAVLQSNTAAAETTYSAPSGNSAGFAWKESVTAGFDIVTYTGTGANRTVAHSLGVAPKMMIFKNRSSATNWAVYHASLANASTTLELNTTGAADGTNATTFNATAPTASVFSLGVNSRVNTNGNNYVAYLFSEVAGYSKFGSYTGNGSTDGAFVFTGFHPRYVMIKNISTTGDWWVVDTARSTVNVASAWLNPNLSNAESSAISIDILSNGFKFRSAAGNDNGQNWIYACFAENPFKNSLAR